MSRLFLAEAAPTHPHAFWRDRADAPDGARRPTPPPCAKPSSGSALGARLSASARARPRLESRPRIRGHEIVLDPHIVSGDESIRFVAGIDVVALMELAPRFSQVPDLFEAYCRAHGEVALHDFLFALATAVARRWLVSQ